MILLFLFIGFVTALVGALPLGASNIAVINTTLKQNTKQAFKIAIAAGVGEVILAYYALHYNMMVNDFFATNQWLQVLIALLLLAIGSFLFFRNNKASKKALKPKHNLWHSKYATGFLLALLNPPVLVYWLLIYGIINSKVAMLSMASPLETLVVFFGGVYIGKVFALYLYSRFSLIIQNKFHNINTKINKITGTLLFSIGILQVVKLYFI